MSSYEFINYLHNNNINYIIRFKNNSKNYKDRIINFKDTRVIKYQQIIEKEVFNKNYGNSSDGFKHKSVILEYLNNYTVVTNLKLEDYNDDSIKELYKKRWCVEIFFKLLKYNFKFEKIIEYNKEKNDISYKKLYLCNLIIIYLAEIIEKINQNTKKKEFLHLMKPNKSNTIKGIFKTLEFIIKSKLTINILKNISNNYVTYVKIKKGLNNDRVSKTPFTKWTA